MKMKFYLAGRITGNARYVEEFAEAAAFYKAQGIIVLNPAVLPEGMEYADYSRICMAMIDSADAVVILPDWQLSLGAKLEKDYATYCRKAVRYYEEDLKSRPFRPHKCFCAESDYARECVFHTVENGRNVCTGNRLTCSLCIPMADAENGRGAEGTEQGSAPQEVPVKNAKGERPPEERMKDAGSVRRKMRGIADEIMEMFFSEDF